MSKEKLEVCTQRDGCPTYPKTTCQIKKQNVTKDFSDTQVLIFHFKFLKRSLICNLIINSHFFTVACIFRTKFWNCRKISYITLYESFVKNVFIKHTYTHIYMCVCVWVCVSMNIFTYVCVCGGGVNISSNYLWFSHWE